MALLAARLALRSADPAAVGLAVLPCLAVLALGRRRARRLAGTPLITLATPVGVALAVVAYAVLGAALVVL